MIDWHANLWLEEHFSPSERELASRTGSATDGSPEAFERDVASCCEEFVVITMNFPILGIEVPNEFVADFVRRYPDRAKGLACVDPMRPDAAKQVEFAVRELGLHGLKISPVYGCFDPWSPQAAEVYRACDRLGVPLLWHQSAGYASQCALEYGNPVLLDRIGREFPRLRMIVAHLGQPWMEETVVLLRKHPQIFADLSARFHRKWQLYNGLMVALEYNVTDRILFGSDFPLRTSEAAAREFRSLNDWGEGVRLPVFPTDLIDEIIENRPLELVWPD